MRYFAGRWRSEIAATAITPDASCRDHRGWRTRINPPSSLGRDDQIVSRPKKNVKSCINQSLKDIALGIEVGDQGGINCRRRTGQFCSLAIASLFVSIAARPGSAPKT